MKNLLKLTAALGLVFIFALSCGSSPSKSKADELDTKIREASDYLNERIPEKKKIAIISIQSDSGALSEYIIDELISNAVNDNRYSVVDRQQLDAARAELNFNSSGEVSDKSAQAVGQFTGAQIIVTGRISKIGETYRFSVRALEVESVQVVGSKNIDIAPKGRIVTLMASGGGSTSGGAASSRPATSGTTTAQAASAQTSAAAAPVVTETPAQPQKQTASFPRVGMWGLTGRDSVNWTANMVIDEIDIDRFSGYFEWREGVLIMVEGSILEECTTREQEK